MAEPRLILSLVASTLVVALAGWVLYLGPRQSLHRAFALFLGAHAALHALAAFNPVVASLGDRLYTHAVAVVPAATANFAIALRYGPRIDRDLAPRRVRAARWGLLAVALAAPVLVITRRPWFFDAPLYLTDLLADASYLVHAGVALLFALHYRRRDHGVQRFGSYAMALAFSFVPTYWVARFWTGAGMDPGSLFGLMDLSIMATTSALLVAVFGIMAFTLVRERDINRGIVFFALSGLPLLQAGITWYATRHAAVPAAGFDAFARITGLLVLVVMAAYAILRYRFLDIEIHAKAVLAQSTLAGIVAGLFFLVSESLEQSPWVTRALPADTPVLDVTTAAAIALALRPLQKLAARLADRVMPGVERTPEYYRRRRLDVYQAALENAMADGQVTERERTILRGLRDDLGVPTDAADRMEKRILTGPAGRGATGAADAGPAGLEGRGLPAQRMARRPARHAGAHGPGVGRRGAPRPDAKGPDLTRRGGPP